MEINKARANPARYAEMYIKPRLQHYKDKLYKGKMKTKEGVAAVEECLKIMNAVKPLEPLKPEVELYKLAKEHTDKQSKTAETGHDTPGGKSFDKRFKKLIKSGYTVGENIAYGEKTAIEIVVQLLIDDGVKNRGHRKNILEIKYTHCGISFGEHQKYRHMCTIDFYGIPKDKKK